MSSLQICTFLSCFDSCNEHNDPSILCFQNNETTSPVLTKPAFLFERNRDSFYSEIKIRINVTCMKKKCDIKDFL